MSNKQVNSAQLPGPLRIVWGSAACCWLAGAVNPGFLEIAIMMLLMIPVLLIEKYFPERFEKIRSDNSA